MYYTIRKKRRYSWRTRGKDPGPGTFLRKEHKRGPSEYAGTVNTDGCSLYSVVTLKVTHSLQYKYIDAARRCLFINQTLAEGSRPPHAFDYLLIFTPQTYMYLDPAAPPLSVIRSRD